LRTANNVAVLSTPVRYLNDDRETTNIWPLFTSFYDSSQFCKLLIVKRYGYREDIIIYIPILACLLSFSSSPFLLFFLLHHSSSLSFPTFPLLHLTCYFIILSHVVFPFIPSLSLPSPFFFRIFNIHFLLPFIYM
jgi:hypothetical protein